MGALIISADSRHPIGWLLSVIGVATALSLVAEAYALWVLHEGGPGPSSLGGLAGWVSSLLGGQLAIAGLGLMFLLAPRRALPVPPLAVRRLGHRPGGACCASSVSSA